MIFRIGIFVLLLLFLASCSSKWSSNSGTGGEDEGVSYRASLGDDERVELAKKRKSYITGIRKGDFYSLRNAPEEALSYYLSVQEKLPDDQVVRKKTAHVYAIMKNWSKAYSEYIKVPLSELSTEERTELLASLFFDESTFDRLGELQKLSISENEATYYKLVDTCYTGIHNCILAIEAYSGTLDSITALQNQISNAEKITSDFQYRNLLVAAKFYEQGMYRATEKILREILLERPDYGELKKMLGFSLFSLGKYEEAKKYILEYLDANPKEFDSIILLGEIYFYLSDPVSSNLYFNNAIIAGYPSKINLERRLAYNYSLLGDTVGMMKVLSYLLDEEEVTEDDFAVAISMAISEGDLTRAETWARKGREKFPDSHKIGPLYAQVLRLEGQIDNASAIIQNTSESVMKENPSYLLEKGIILYNLSDYAGAMEIFESLLELSDWPDIVEEARIYIARIRAS